MKEVVFVEVKVTLGYDGEGAETYILDDEKYLDFFNKLENHQEREKFLSIFASKVPYSEIPA